MLINIPVSQSSPINPGSQIHLNEPFVLTHLSLPTEQLLWPCNAHSLISGILKVPEELFITYK